MVAIFFVGGLIIGSFLNVVIYRLNSVETLLGRSHCRNCNKLIHWYDNIPLISFLVLRGQCRDCQTKISWQYPAVELGVAVVFSVIGWIFFDLSSPISWLVTGYYLFMTSLMVVLFVYDWLYMEVPMIVAWTGIVAGCLFAAVYNLLPSNFVQGHFSGYELVPIIISSAGVFLFFFLLSFLSKEKWMGSGDAYVALIGCLLVGWPLVLAALMIAFTTGSIIGVLLIIFKGKSLNTQVPFAPFLVFGAIVALMLANFSPMLGSLFFLFTR